MKKEAMNLRDSEEGYTEGLEGREKKGEMSWLYYNSQKQINKKENDIILSEITQTRQRDATCSFASVFPGPDLQMCLCKQE